MIFLLAVGCGAIGLFGCQKADDAVVQKLDEISKKLDKLDDIEKKLASGAGAARPSAAPQGPVPGRPDPGKVYSVPIDGAPFKGAKNAKITVIEACEFA
jgi:hypothetical protein